MGRLSENSVLNIKNKSHAVTAEIEVPAGAEGVIIAQGGNIGGWSHLCEGRQAKILLQLLGIKHFYAESKTRFRRATTRSGWSSHMRVAALERVANVPCMWMARRSAKARVPLRLRDGLLRRRWTRCRQRYRRLRAQDYGPRGNAFNGKVAGIEIAINTDVEKSGSPR